MLSGESIMSESQERSAALRERLKRIAQHERQQTEHGVAYVNISVDVLDEIVAALELREAAASLSPQPAPVELCGDIFTAGYTDLYCTKPKGHQGAHVATPGPWRPDQVVLGAWEAVLPKPAPAPQKGELIK
jgi:hypothetical protein